MAIVIPILTEYSNKGVNQALRELKSADDKFAAFGKVAKTAFLGAAAGAGVFAIAVGVDAVKAAAEDEEAVRGLAKTLDNIGFGSAAGDVEKFITQMQASTAVADTELRPAFERIVRSTRDVAEAQRVTRIALDASAASGKSLEAVSNALGKAYDGNLTSLSRLGLGIDSATLKTGDMAAITAELARLTNGQAVAATKTFAGQIRLLEVAADEAKETIGYALIGAIDRMTKAVGGTSGATGAMQSFADAIAESIDNVGFLTSKLLTLGKWMGAVDTDADSLIDTLVGGFGPVGDIALGLQDLIGLWRQADDAAQAAASRVGAYAGAWDSVTVAAMNAANASYRAAAAASQARANAAVTDRYTAQARALGKTISYTGGNLSTYFAQLGRVNTATSGSSSGGGGGGGAIAATSKLEKQYAKLAASVDKTRAALDAAGTELEEAKQQLADYADAYAGWLTGSVSLSDAVNTAAASAGTDAAVSWLDAFTAQLKAGRDAQAVMEALRATLDPGNVAGNEALVAQLLTLPPAQAAAVAQDIVDRGIGPELARQLAEYQLFAGAAGESWASQFYGSGVTAAQAQYDAIAATLSSKLGDLYKLGKRMGDEVAAGFRDALRDLPPGVTVPGRGRSSSSTYSTAPITVNVTAGVGDPVAIARVIETALRSRNVRLGTSR